MLSYSQEQDVEKYYAAHLKLPSQKVDRCTLFSFTQRHA